MSSWFRPSAAVQATLYILFSPLLELGFVFFPVHNEKKEVGRGWKMTFTHFKNTLSWRPIEFPPYRHPQPTNRCWLLSAVVQEWQCFGFTKEHELFFSAQCVEKWSKEGTNWWMPVGREKLKTYKSVWVLWVSVFDKASSTSNRDALYGVYLSLCCWANVLSGT